MAVVPECKPAPGEKPKCNADKTAYVTYTLQAAGTPCQQRVRCVMRTCPPQPLPECM